MIMRQFDGFPRYFFQGFVLKTSSGVGISGINSMKYFQPKYSFHAWVSRSGSFPVSSRTFAHSGIFCLGFRVRRFRLVGIDHLLYCGKSSSSCRAVRSPNINQPSGSLRIVSSLAASLVPGLNTDSSPVKNACSHGSRLLIVRLFRFRLVGIGSPPWGSARFGFQGLKIKIQGFQCCQFLGSGIP
jgi:hypothetical protein